MAPTFTNRDLSFAGAKVILFSGSCKFFGKFLSKKIKKSIFVGVVHYLMYLCSRYRDLAQLVAHVVRDDEVAGSSPVIPTKSR